jgi:hypothetical protein
LRQRLTGSMRRRPLETFATWSMKICSSPMLPLAFAIRSALVALAGVPPAR